MKTQTSYIILYLVMVCAFFSCKESPKNSNQIKLNTWYLSSPEGRGYLFQSDQHYKVMKNGEDIGLQGTYTQENQGKFRLKPASGGKKIIAFASKKDEVQIFNTKYYINPPTPPKKFTLVTTKWYLTNDQNFGYLFLEDKSYLAVEKQKYQGKLGTYSSQGERILLHPANQTNSNIAILPNSRKGKAFKVKGRDFFLLENLEKKEIPVEDVKEKFKILKLKYSENASLEQLLKKVEIKRDKMASLPVTKFTPSPESQKFQKFRYKIFNSASGLSAIKYVTAKRDANYGTKTKYGYYLDKGPSDTYIFVKVSDSRRSYGGKRSSSGIQSSDEIWDMNGQDYKVSLSKRPAKRIPKSLLKVIDPERFREKHNLKMKKLTARKKEVEDISRELLAQLYTVKLYHDLNEALNKDAADKSISGLDKDDDTSKKAIETTETTSLDDDL